MLVQAPEMVPGRVLVLVRFWCGSGVDSLLIALVTDLTDLILLKGPIGAILRTGEPLLASNPLVMRRIGTNKGRGVRKNKKKMILHQISAVESVRWWGPTSLHLTELPLHQIFRA